MPVYFSRAFFPAGVTFLMALASPAPVQANDLTARLKDLEKQSGGRLGVVIIDGNSRTKAYRGDERFLMCSTFKLLLVGAVLQKVDRGRESLFREVSFSKADILAHAPETSKFVGQGHLHVGHLCEAVMQQSDNTAANLLLASLGGPQSLTKFARSLGDTETRIDRKEPELNTPKGDFDTTTPRSMANDTRKLLFGKVLSTLSRHNLEDWMRASVTGQTCIRAGLPPRWTAPDKSGLGGLNNRAGDSDTRNDVAILWPPKGSPIIVAAYLTGCQLPAPKREAILAQVGRIVSKN